MILRGERRATWGLERWLVACLVLFASAVAATPPDDLPARATEALRRATEYLTVQAGDRGRYPQRYDPSTGAKYAGDERLEPTAFVIGPGATAAAGLVFLNAFEVTGEADYRDAALAAARALAAVQLASGGWPAVADPTASPGLYTRQLALRSTPQEGRENTSRLDQGLAAEPLRLILALGELTGDVELREAGGYGLRSLLNAQLANGAWPAAWPLPADDRRLATLDGATPDLIELLAAQADPAAQAAAVAGGDFLLLTRLQPPGWAVRYSARLQPRGFLDPPSTLAAVRALLALHAATGEPRFLRPVADQLAWLREQPDAGEVTAEAVWRGANPDLPRPEPSRHERARRTAARAPEVLRLVGALDAQGRWLDGEIVHLGATVARMRRLLDYLRDYEPIPQYPGPGDGRPPQHRRM